MIRLLRHVHDGFMPDGIVVREFDHLVDFVELRLAGGHASRSRVIDAGAVRFRSHDADPRGVEWGPPYSLSPHFSGWR